jgi:hypothetical protein
VPSATIDLDDRFHSRTDREGNYGIGIVGRAWIRMTVGKPGFCEKSKWLNTKDVLLHPFSVPDKIKAGKPLEWHVAGITELGDHRGCALVIFFSTGIRRSFARENLAAAIVTQWLHLIYGGLKRGCPVIRISVLGLSGSCESYLRNFPDKLPAFSNFV